MKNLSIKSGKFPSIFKTARVCPIFKSGDACNPDNYRPIAVLPCLSKIIERHIANSLYIFLNSNDLLNTTQSGFRPKHSCTTALTKLVDEWLANIDNGEINGVIFLDLKKAFDLVNHIILLKKLEYYNVSNCTLDWFKSYLIERSQQVKVNNVMSNTKCIKTGVPQGSILGPLLFILYINDLPLNIEHSLIDLYADDSTLHCKGNNLLQLTSNLQNDIHVIENWCSQNCMKLNAKKCKSMIIGSKQRLCLTGNSLDINISNEQIENVDCEKLLGLYIDKN